MPEQFWQLSEAGIGGIIIALIFVILVLIGCVAKIVLSFNKTVSNHMKHQTDADIELAKSLTKLNDSMVNNTRVTEKLGDRIDRLFNGRK